MIDATTKEPLRVSTDGTTWSVIDVPVSQLDEVQQLLDQHRISYWVDENVISFNGGPEYACIILARGTDPQPIQAILDNVR